MRQRFGTLLVLIITVAIGLLGCDKQEVSWNNLKARATTTYPGYKLVGSKVYCSKISCSGFLVHQETEKTFWMHYNKGRLSTITANQLRPELEKVIKRAFPGGTILEIDYDDVAAVLTIQADGKQQVVRVSPSFQIIPDGT